VAVSCSDWTAASVAPLTFELPVVVRPERHLAERKGIKSIDSQVETSITFANHSKQTIKVWWLDYDGKRQLKHTLRPGESFGPQRTFLTHPWLVTDEEGNAWSLHLPDAQPRRVVVLEPSASARHSAPIPAIAAVVSLVAGVPDAAEPRGPLLLIGGRHQDLRDDIRDKFFELAGGKEAKVVVIPTGVANPELNSPEEFLKPPRDMAPRSMQVLHTRDRKTADDPAFVKPLTEATAVFFTNGHLHRLTDVYPGTLVEKELQRLSVRGGVIAGTGTGATILGDMVINQPHQEPPTGAGLRLLAKFVILDDDSERRRPRLVQGLEEKPDHVGLMVIPGAAVMIHGPKLRVFGDGPVTIRLAKGSSKDATTATHRAGAEVDINALRREAASRAVNE